MPRVSPSNPFRAKRRLVGVATSIIAVVFLSACDSESTELSDESTWETIQSKIFEPNCTGCHTAGTDFARQSDLVLTADVAYTQLVDVPPKNSAARDDGLMRVSSEGLAGLHKSLMWEKINAPDREHFLNDHPEYGSLMPLGAPPLTNGEIELIRRWIVAGAPSDVQVTDPAPMLADRTRFEEQLTFQELSPPAQGVAIRLGPFDVAPHFERELFYFEPLDDTEDLLVDRIEISMRSGSHHFILYTLADDTPPELVPAPRTYRDIRSPGGGLNINNMRIMEHHVFFAGTQRPLLDFRFPPGVALRLPAGTGFDLNPHNVNRTDETRQGEVHVNLHTVEPANVDHVAEVLFLNNLNISLPPKATTTLTRTYTFFETRHFIQFVSHAHEHNQEFRVYVSGGPRSGELVYISYDWEHPPIENIDPPLTLNPGEGLRLEATYNNWTDRTLNFGLLSEDEMMILFGYYYTD